MINLTQNWWLVVLRGVAAILFGIAAFVWPGPTLFALIILFGLYALIDGFIAVATSVSHSKDSPRWWVFLIEGLVGVVIGIVALVWPGLTTLALLGMIAAWSIITGVLEIAAAIRLRRAITNEWMLALGGILSIALGVVLLLQPLAGTLIIVWTMGAYAIISGVLWVILGFQLRSVDKTLRPQTVYIHPSKKGSTSRL